MNHLWLEGATPTSVMTSWVLKEGRPYVPSPSCCKTTAERIILFRLYDEAMQTLTKLHIMQSNTSGTKAGLQPAFQRNIRLALTGGGDHMSFGIPCEKGGDSATIDLLDQHAAERWEVRTKICVSAVVGRLTKSARSLSFISWYPRERISGQQSQPKGSCFSSIEVD